MRGNLIAKGFVAYNVTAGGLCVMIAAITKDASNMMNAVKDMATIMRGVSQELVNCSMISPTGAELTYKSYVFQFTNLYLFQLVFMQLYI